MAPTLFRASRDFLNNPEARARFRREIALFLATDHYRGLMIDFESFPKKAQPGYVALLNELSSDLHAKGMKLYVSVQVRNEDYDYKAISSAVDGVVIMNYDEHFPGGTPGPVASQEWFTANLESAVKEIPKEKLICAIGNYGYDWVERPKKGKLPPGLADKSVSVQEAWVGSRDAEEDVDFDGDALNPHFSYRDDDNFRHDVWFLDAVTALNEMRAAQTFGIQTFALWRLGAEDRSLWRVWDMPGEANASDRLKDVPSRPGRRHGGQRRNPPYRGAARQRRTRTHHRQANRAHRRRGIQESARALPCGALWRQQEPTRHYF